MTRSCISSLGVVSHFAAKAEPRPGLPRPICAAAPCENIIASHGGVISVAATDTHDQATALGPRGSSCINIFAPSGGLGSGLLGASAKSPSAYTRIVSRWAHARAENKWASARVVSRRDSARVVGRQLKLDMSAGGPMQDCQKVSRGARHRESLSVRATAHRPQGQLALFF
jgi:hypothetical protein